MDREWRLDTSLGLAATPLAATPGRQGIWRRVCLSSSYGTLTERFTLSVLFLNVSDRNTDIEIPPGDIWDLAKRRATSASSCSNISRVSDVLTSIRCWAKRGCRARAYCGPMRLP